MSWKRYQNELIVLAALLLMFGAYLYKHNQVKTQIEGSSHVQHTLAELKEVIALQKVWKDKTIQKKIKALKGTVASAKRNWQEKKQKISATYTGLSAQELNKIATKILNLPVEIILFDIKKIGQTYNVEFKCKW